MRVFGNYAKYFRNKSRIKPFLKNYISQNLIFAFKILLKQQKTTKTVKLGVSMPKKAFLQSNFAFFDNKSKTIDQNY